jgi:hypothetical protein
MGRRNNELPSEQKKEDAVPEQERSQRPAASAGSAPPQVLQNDQDAVRDHIFRHWSLSPAMRQLRRVLKAHEDGGEN